MCKFWYTIERNNLWIIGVPEEGGGQKVYLKKYWLKTSQIWEEFTTPSFVKLTGHLKISNEKWIIFFDTL